MSYREDMTDHVLSAIVDQIPDEHLIKAHELIERRMEWQTLLVVCPSERVFHDVIEESVGELLSEIGKYSGHSVSLWTQTYKNEWEKRFDTYDLYEAVSKDTLDSLTEDLKYFIACKMPHLHDDLILKHYGVNP